MMRLPMNPDSKYPKLDWIDAVDTTRLSETTRENTKSSNRWVAG
jgi:hypothetical protein